MPNLISGAAAMEAFKKFDLSQWQQLSQRGTFDVAFARDSRGRAFDSAPSSGLAFLQSALELIEPKLVEPLQAVTHQRDIPIKIGGGFPQEIAAWAVNYASAGGGQLGLQGTSNTDIPNAQIDMEKGTWNTFNWTQGFTISYIDLERMKRANASGNQPPFSLQSVYERSVRTIWMKALDFVTYAGFQGLAGLLNNPNVPAAVAPNGGSGTTWASKTATQILTDVNLGINQTWENSGYSLDGVCDTLLLPPNQFALLTQPMAIGGVGYDSTIEYIRRNCVAAQYFDGNKDRFKIRPLPAPWIAGTGIGNTAAAGNATGGNGLDRAFFYRKDEECVQLRIPTPMEPAMTIPTIAGPGYSTLFVGNISQVIFLRTTTAFYLDGI